MTTSVVCALCAEFGARQYRILIFNVSASLVTIEDRLSEPFSNAQVGQWYSVEDGGQFWPIEPPLKTVTLPGDAYFCCKIALPVLFAPVHSMVGGVDTFHSPYIGQNGGPVLFSVDEAGLDRSTCYEAFVSLASFNAPPGDTNQTAPITNIRSSCKWSLARKSDICGSWNGITSPLTPLKVRRNLTAVGSCLLLSTPSTNNELVLESNSARDAQSKSVPVPPSTAKSKSVPPAASTIKSKSVPVPPSTTKSKSVPPAASTENPKSVPVLPSTAKSKSVPTPSSTEKSKSVPSASSNAKSKSVPPPSCNQSTTVGNTANSSGSAGGREGGASAQSSKSVPNLVNPNGASTAGNVDSKGSVESVKRNELVLCWKLTAEDAFLVVCSDDQPRFSERIQCRKSWLSMHKVSVGKFYSIEYSRYSAPNSPHVRISVLNEASSPLETRLVNGELQLRIFLWRAKELYWSEFCEVTQVPKGSPDVCRAWCKLNDKLHKGRNILVFVQLIDDLLNNAVTNGNCTNRPLDAIELDEIYGSDQVFASDRQNGSPDSITSEILRAKALKSTKIIAEQKPLTLMTDGQRKGEVKKLAKVYMQIKRSFHPWIRGPFDQGLKAMERAGVSVEFKPNSNDIVLSGTDAARVDEYANKLRTLRDGPIRKATQQKCRVAAKLYTAIAKVVDDLLSETGAIIVLPPTDCAQDKVIEVEISFLGTAEQISHVWKCLSDLYGPHDVGELIAESTGKEIGDEKILRCIAAAQQKLQPASVSGPSRKMETPAEPKRDNNTKSGGGGGGGGDATRERAAKAHCSPPPFSSSHCPGRSGSPASVSNGFRFSRASARLGSTNSLASLRSQTPSQMNGMSIRGTPAPTLPLAQIRRKTIDYPDWQWRYLVGNGGEALTKMVIEVQEAGGHQPNALSYDFKENGRLHFSGPSDAVDELYKKINAKISLLNKNGAIVKDTINVEKQFHCQVIGKGGEFLRRLKRKHGVKEIIVPSEFSHSDQVRVEGPSIFSLNSCKEDLLKLVDDWRNDVYEEVQVQRHFVPMIRGRNSKKILGLLDGLPKVEVDLPPHANEDMAEGSLIKIRGHKSEVTEFIERLNVFIDNLDKNHHEEFISLPLDDPNHSSLEFAKFVCAKKKQIENRFSKLKLDFQSDDESAENSNRTVRLNGPLDQVEAAKMIVLELIGKLREIVVVNRCPSLMLIACDSAHHTEFLRNNGLLLKEIKEEHTQCVINLNKRLQRFEISCASKHSGNRSKAMESAKAHIEKIIKLLDSKIVHHVLIPSRYHRKLGTHLSSLREQFNVRIQMPSKNIDGEPIVVIGPDKGSVEATERALRALCPVTEHIEVSAEHCSSLSRRGGAIVRELMKKHSVQIVVPRCDSNSSCNVSVCGTPENVRSCLMEIREHILPITHSILVSNEVRGSLLGCGGFKVKQICDKFLVKIHFTSKSENCSEATITGRPANVDECERYILSKIAQLNKDATSRHVDPFGYNVN